MFAKALEMQPFVMRHLTGYSKPDQGTPGEMRVTCKAILPRASQPSAPWRQLRLRLQGPLQSGRPSGRGVGPEALCSRQLQQR